MSGLSVIAIIASMVGSNGSLTPLNGAQLRSLLHNVMLRTVRPGIISSDPELERFEENGTYVRYFDRVRVTGSFEIRDNMFCIRLAGHESETCREVFVDSRSRLFVRAAGATEESRQVDIVADSGSASPAVPLAVPPPLDRLARLSGDEIRTALVGHRLTFDPVSYDPLPLAERVFEFLFEDGRAQQTVGYGSTAGRWRIEGDHLCLTLRAESERCRSVYRDGDGRTYIIREDDVSRTPYPISRWGE